MKGTINRWFDFRGFGFIGIEDQEKDVFLHTSDVKGFTTPHVGDTVDFEIRESPKGPRAVNVDIL
jgi:CspA family cold shock protein